MPDFVEQYLDRSKGYTGGQKAWLRVEEDAAKFVARLQIVQPTLIDFFLAWNESLQPIAKLLIAAVILDCEAKYRVTRINKNRDRRDTKPKDGWYRFLIHKLLLGCQQSSDLLDNQVQFVTFNYDTSLEDILYEALSSIDMKDEKDIRKFLDVDRVIHVYGSVHASIPSAGDYVDPSVADGLGSSFPEFVQFHRELSPRKRFLDQCYEASKNLQTIDPHEKVKNRAVINASRRWIDDADIVYILGYGFDDSNNRRLALGDSLRVKKTNKKSVVFTNLENLNTVNKRASRVFYGTYDKFLSDFAHGFPSVGNFREKSVRTVYEAMEKDFDSLENLIIAGSKI